LERIDRREASAMMRNFHRAIVSGWVAHEEVRQ